MMDVARRRTRLKDKTDATYLDYLDPQADLVFVTQV